MITSFTLYLSFVTAFRIELLGRQITAVFYLEEVIQRIYCQVEVKPLKRLRIQAKTITSKTEKMLLVIKKLFNFEYI